MAGRLDQRFGSVVGVGNDRGEPRPVIERVGVLAAALVQLGEAEQRDDMRLIDREHPLERAAFGIVILQSASGGGEIDPQRRRVRIARGGREKMLGGRGSVAVVERGEAHRVACHWVSRVEREHLLKPGAEAGLVAGGAGARRGGEQLIDLGLGHARGLAHRGDARQAALAAPPPPWLEAKP